jgi:hypothetical protein
VVNALTIRLLQEQSLRMPDLALRFSPTFMMFAAEIANQIQNKETSYKRLSFQQSVVLRRPGAARPIPLNLPLQKSCCGLQAGAHEPGGRKAKLAAKLPLRRRLPLRAIPANQLFRHVQNGHFPHMTLEAFYSPAGPWSLTLPARKWAY